MEIKAYECNNCGREIKPHDTYFRLSAVIKTPKEKIEKNFCSLDCANRWNLIHKGEMHLKETLEKEIKVAFEEEKEHVEKGRKAAEEQEKINEIKQGTVTYKKKEKPEVEVKYKEEFKPEEYIENQEFYVKKEDFDTIKKTIHEIKSQDPSMARVDDSDVYEIEPETRKLKLRKMPRTILDRLKEKKIILDYYKPL